jgi:GT2 family glycosyltransferase
LKAAPLLWMNKSQKRLLFLVVLVITSALLLYFRSVLDNNNNLKLDLLVADSLRPKILFRIELWFEGKCIGSSPNGRIVVMFCNPREEQYFHFLPDGRLMFGVRGNSGVDHGKCLLLDNTGLLVGDCSSALKFDLVLNDTYLRAQEYGLNKRCVSPIARSREAKGPVPKLKPANGDPVSLTECHKEASRITVIEEATFQEDRKYLKLPLLENDSKCDFPACGINKAAPPAAPLPSQTVRRCSDLSKCVTVITKTARRPLLVLRMIDSIRKFQNYRNLSVIAYDDGIKKHPRDIMKRISTYPNLTYIIGDEEDLGIARGRNLALRHVTTEYFLLLDDDNLFLPSTDLELLVEILDTTDATLVGGTFKGYKDFASLLHFGYAMSKKTGGKQRRLSAYRGACLKTNETITGFPTCVRCELTSNDFLARTRDILEVGGWSPELKTQEHKDLFVRLKAASKKVVYCPSFEVENRRAKRDMNVRGFHALRHGREAQMRNLFANRWNVINRYNDDP